MSVNWGIGGGAVAIVTSLIGGGAAHGQTDPPPSSFQARVTAAEEVPIQYHRLVFAEVFNAHVVQVIDDRTLIVHRDDKDRDESVRLFGVQAPRADDKSAARDYLSKEMKNSNVRVEAQARDKRGLVTAFVTPIPPPPPQHLLLSPDVTGLSAGIRDDPPNAPGADYGGSSTSDSGKSLNETLMRLGLARYDAHQAPNVKELADAERDAQKGHKGIWSVPSATVTTAEKP